VKVVKMYALCFMSVYVARMGQMRNACNILIRRPEWNRSVGRSRSRWADIRMALRKLGLCVDWIHLAQNREQWRALVNVVMNLRVP